MNSTVEDSSPGPSYQLLTGHVLDQLRLLPTGLAQVVVTSPPYYGLRNYRLDEYCWGGEISCAHAWEGVVTPRPNQSGGPTAKQVTNAGSFVVSYQARTTSSAFCAQCGAWRGSLGLGPTPQLYVDHLVVVFRELKRVLRTDGTFWVVIADSYNAAGRNGHGTRIGAKQGTNRASAAGDDASWPQAPDLKPKDLIGIPWMLAFALRADGWYLRSDIIWSKVNAMPASVTDRPTSAHEYVFMFAQSERYFYDHVATLEPFAEATMPRRGRKDLREKSGYAAAYFGNPPNGLANSSIEQGGRNKRSVWTAASQPFDLQMCTGCKYVYGRQEYRALDREGDTRICCLCGSTEWVSHFAAYPGVLIEPCILAGSSEHGACPECGASWRRVLERTQQPDPSYRGSTLDTGKTGSRDGGDRTQPGVRLLKQRAGWAPGCKCGRPNAVPQVVLDPFSGTATTGVVALRLGRRYVGIDANPDYTLLAEERIRRSQCH